MYCYRQTIERTSIVCTFLLSYMEKHSAKELIINTLIEKTSTKRIVFENTVKVCGLFKDACQLFADSYNSELLNKGIHSNIEFKERDTFDFELHFSDDILFFCMHSNIFTFDKGSTIWKSSYLQNEPNASYCGVISIYNFLADSFKYNRTTDIGYLVARIFINKDLHYFVEGKRQLGFLYNDFVNSVIDLESIQKIIESTLLFTLDFDLLVPEYNNVNTITVAQMLENITSAKTQTAKRLGFKFTVDSNQF